VEAIHRLPAPDGAAQPSSAPILPQAPARPAPSFERREFDVQLVIPPRERKTSMRAYLIGTVGLVAVSVGGWFALSDYIYG